MRSENQLELQTAAEKNLTWFRRSGIMQPADGSWGVAERLSVAEGPALEKMKISFPAWTTHPSGLVLEQRRADCNFETALLFLAAGDGETGKNILDYLYFRSGLLNRYDERFPRAGWNWSHIKWESMVYFDDNAWCIFIPLAIARAFPELELRYDLKHWAVLLAESMTPAMHRTFGAENPEEKGTWRDPEGKWCGRLDLPHWGSLAVMALARAFQENPNPAYEAEIRRYHAYLAENLANFTVSEAAYAVFGAAAACRVFHHADDEALLHHAARLMLEKIDPESGNLPAEHYEAPIGKHLVDTIYTVNWAFLAFQMAAAVTGAARYRNAAAGFAELLVKIQDQSSDPFFNGCWRGMYDLNAGRWGGGDCYEGGSGSIYSGWTNAPIALGLLLEEHGGSLLDFFE